MNIMITLSVVTATSLLTCLVLCSFIILLRKKIRTAERRLKNLSSIVNNMNDILKSNLVILEQANRLLLLFLDKEKKESESTTRREADKREIILH